MSKSKRICEIINMIDNCDRLLDVGCDHGFISIGAVEEGKAKTAIACDIRPEPLCSAKKNIELSGLSNSIVTVLSDGLKQIEIAADTICIAGMGGNTIKNILSDAVYSIRNRQFSPLEKAGQLILGPQSELPELRHFIIQNTDFYILYENIVYDEGKYYSLMDVRRKDFEKENLFDYNELQYEFGINLKGDYITYLENLEIRLKTSLENANKGNSFNAAKQAKLLKQRSDMLNDYIKMLNLK